VSDRLQLNTGCCETVRGIIPSSVSTDLMFVMCHVSGQLVTRTSTAADRGCCCPQRHPATPKQGRPRHEWLLLQTLQQQQQQRKQKQQWPGGKKQW
jgi:hypothetical protein